MKVTEVGSRNFFCNTIPLGIFSKLNDDGGKENPVAFEETSIENGLGKDFYDRFRLKKKGLILDLNLSNF